MYVCMCVHVGVCVCMYVCMCVHVGVCMCVHTSIKGGGHKYQPHTKSNPELKTPLCPTATWGDVSSSGHFFFMQIAARDHHHVGNVPPIDAEIYALSHMHGC